MTADVPGAGCWDSWRLWRRRHHGGRSITGTLTEPPGCEQLAARLRWPTPGSGSGLDEEGSSDGDLRPPGCGEDLVRRARPRRTAGAPARRVGRRAVLPAKPARA